METNGFYGTIVANKRTGHIVAGNHRYAVAKSLHYDTVPVAWIDVDAEEEVRIMVADNRTTRLGLDNESKLAELLAELSATPIGLDGTGFDTEDLDEMIQRLSGTWDGSMERGNAIEEDGSEAMDRVIVHAPRSMVDDVKSAIADAIADMDGVYVK
jgi:ParB-like chromosome segregation protein Spo0J